MQPQSKCKNAYYEIRWSGDEICTTFFVANVTSADIYLEIKRNAVAMCFLFN